MTASASADHPSTAARGGIIPRLSTNVRRVVLITHLAAIGIWLGMEAVLGVLVVNALASPGAVALAMGRAIATYIGWPLIVVALVTLVSGMVLGLGSKYGLIRYRWVTVKLVLTIVLVILVLVVLVPSVSDLGAATAAASAESFTLDEQLLYPPIVSSTALLFATTLSVVKPWGRRRGAR